MNVDFFRVLSDREVRTFAAKLFDLPLYLETLTGLENKFINCSKHLVEDPTLEDIKEHEAYYVKDMPQITLYLFSHCSAVLDLVKDKFKPVPKYKTILLDDSDIAFKMIQTNVSHVVGMLDDVRKHTKKFICLNDNIDHSRDDAKTVKAILSDFYESLFPIVSQFELPRDYRNRFLHMDQLREWREYRDTLRFWTHIALGLLVCLTIISFFGDKIDIWRRRCLSHRWRRKRSSCENSESSLSSNSSVDCSLSWSSKDFIETV